MLDYLIYTPTWTAQFTWLLAVAFIFAFLVSYGMGANDSCNDWGPAVGAGTVKLWQAYVLCGIFNTIGAILLGYKVTETLRSGIVEFSVFDVYSQYNHTIGQYETVPFCENATAIEGFTFPRISNNTIVECAKYTSADFMIGQTGAMAGVAAFMIVSSVYKIPVSATHAIVGGSLASSLYLRGNVGIKWMEIAGIVCSWFISPLIAGFFAGFFYIVIKFTVLMRKDPFRWSLWLCPVFMAFTLTVNLFACIYDGSKYLGFDKLNIWQAMLISAGTGLIGCLILEFPLRGWLERRAHRLLNSEVRKTQKKLESGELPKKSKITDMKTPETDMDKLNEMPWYKFFTTAVPEDRLTTKVFNALQIVSSSLLSFSHGANDTANTVGPLLAVWMTYQTGYAFGAAETRDDSQALLAFGAIAMIFGFVTLGHRTIKLIAKEITVDMSPVSGFAIELGTAFTVLVCVKIGIPISSTHCAVGAVLFVGLAKSTSEGVSFNTFKKICLVWLLCFPVSAAISLVVTIILKQFA